MPQKTVVAMNKSQALECIVEEAGRGELIFPTNMSASLKLQRALSDPDCHLETAAEMVLAEPLIAARLVAIANSVAYTRYGAHVSNVRAAVSLLGFKPLKSLVAAIVVRQISSAISDARLRLKAELLWHHCANVAALAKVIARDYSDVDPETALFAGIVHEIDGFYLLSRAQQYPMLMDEESDSSSHNSRALLADAILKALKVPPAVANAVESLYAGADKWPPVSCGDVLYLANSLVPVPSPLDEWVGANVRASGRNANLSADDKMLKTVLEAAGAEVQTMIEVLLA